MKNKYAIILPLKENFSNKDFGAVSVWVSEYLKHTKIKTNIIFCRKLPKDQIYLAKNIIPIVSKEKYYTNLTYIKKINAQLIKNKIEHGHDFSKKKLENANNYLVNNFKTRGFISWKSQWV